MLGVNHLSILVRMHRNDAKNMIPPLQKIFECLYDKKANTIFEELSNLCLVV